MELLETNGGLGRIKVTEKEEEIIRAYWSNHDVGSKNIGEWAKVSVGIEGDYIVLPPRTAHLTVEIATPLPFSRVDAVGSEWVQFHIFPADGPGQYFMTVALPQYKTPDVVNDLAAMICASQKKPLKGVEALPTGYDLSQYGISEIPQAADIFTIGNRAKKAVSRSEEMINLRPERLALLCHDAHHHENPFIQQGSRDMYLLKLYELARLA